MVKNLATLQETWVRSLSREDPLGTEMATHSSILACEIPWIEEPGGYSLSVTTELEITERLLLFLAYKKRKMWNNKLNDTRTK